MVQEQVLVDICSDDKDPYMFGFNGMLKDNELKGIGNSLDFGARMLGTRVARWFAIDPLAGKYPSLSPYNFVSNSPLLFVDPNGKAPSVFIDENAGVVKPGKVLAAAEATRQLNEGTSLHISRNPLTGQLTATGAALTPADKRLEQAINDPVIKVEIGTTNSKGILGGAFMGNIVDKGLFPGNFDNKIKTVQLVNPGVLGAADVYYNKPGANMLHETIESYEGGVNSLQTGIRAVNSSIDDKDYENAHAAASAVGAPQAGPWYMDQYDAKGNKVTDKKDVVKTEYSVDDGKKGRKVIQTNP